MFSSDDFQLIKLKKNEKFDVVYVPVYVLLVYTCFSVY